LFVTAGLDPVIHADAEVATLSAKLIEPPLAMDCRVKPGNDE
jgi:hypothetical protein